MKAGYLSQYFQGLVFKRLSAVEADILRSNQHEFNGVRELKGILGQPDGKVRYQAKFIYLTDNEAEPINEDGFLTWYDARQKAREERGVMRYEYRLYFAENTALQCANEDDVLIIALLPDSTILVIVAENETTIAHQILWLFGFEDLLHPGFSVRDELETEQDRIGFASRFILESIGVTVDESEDTYLEDMLERFNGGYPVTKVFSEYARSTLQDMHANDGPDTVLMAWMEREEILFRTLEKYLIAERLKNGFDGDVDGFLKFSLSVQNRRKSRAGLALENHVEALLIQCGIRHTRNGVTENKSKPDFLFPGIAQYHQECFNPINLTMLGVKSTCKDRWRQVLTEAEKIEDKHLLTLEAAISTNQTDEMAARNLQLVVPKELHYSFTQKQQSWLMDFKGFTDLVKFRQNK